MKATATLRNHTNWNQEDYNHLTKKGYTNREIVEIWDRDASEGKGACTWNTPEIPDTVKAIRRLLAAEKR